MCMIPRDVCRATGQCCDNWLSSASARNRRGGEVIVLGIIGTIELCWTLMLLYARGYANLIDSAALGLKWHARRVRLMHQKREALLEKMWTEELRTDE